jgi:SAM-dependent methyltransferase
LYALYDRFAHRYDLHTPPDHYQHDHALVLDLAAEISSSCRLLDVGCGTGVLVEKALRAGFAAKGIDASPGMVRTARTRVGPGAIEERRMQDIDEEGVFDLIVALSWTINYCADRDDLLSILRRMHHALRPRGEVLLQAAHAMHVDGQLMEDREKGPTGDEGDVTISYRFVRLDADGLDMRVDYGYGCTSLGERLSEEHFLHMTDARALAQSMAEVGFETIGFYDSWRRDPFKRSASPFVRAMKRPLEG